MIPTDSNWVDFQCFSENETAQHRATLGITDDKVEIYSLFKAYSDDWSIPSLLASILNREIIGSDMVCSLQSNLYHHCHTHIWM